MHPSNPVSAKFCIATTLALAVALSNQAPTLLAAEIIEEVVVTGSYIRTTPEDAALPVDVITADELQAQGNPTVIEMIQRIPSINGGSYGQSNRFLGTAAQGTVSLNLRGLGNPRTLALLNGQRLPTRTLPGGAEWVDVGQIPFAAIGSVEVLRDGAAATYGSEAVAGVVNFKTRKDLEGFEVSGSFTSIDKSDGDYDGSIAYGWNSDTSNVLLAADISHVSEIRLFDLPFMAARPPGQGDGISLAGNPGQYFTLATPVDANGDGVLEPGTSQGTAFLDLGCEELGSFKIGTRCTYPFVTLESPVSEKDQYHFFGEVNSELAANLRFHLEGHYAATVVPHNKVSTTLSSTQFPTPVLASGGSPGGGTSPYPAIGGETQSRFYVPPTNPGLIALMTDGGCPFDAQICSDALASGVLTSQTAWRPRAMGGSPLFDGDTDEQRAESSSWRISGGFDGDFANDWTWTTRMTYGQDTAQVTTGDLTVNRVQLGLRGLGGEGCDPNTGTPGVGPCLWFNPFANSIERSFQNGKSYAEATGRPLSQLNSKALWGWMKTDQIIEIESELVTLEAVLAGDLGSFETPAGKIDWVLGSQWRYEHRTVMPSVVADPDATPCVDSPPFGDGFPTCTAPGVGPYLFNSPTSRSDLDREVPSVFAELSIPLLENLDVGLAGRYESYGGKVGSTSDYRLSMRWQAIPWLAFRGSSGTTFRAPPIPLSSPGSSRIQAQFSNPIDGAQLYRPVDRVQNPELQPETADTFNLGIALATEDLMLGDTSIGSFKGTIDYYKLTFQQEITVENAAAVYRSMFPNSTPANWQCNLPTLLDRFSFTTNLATNTAVYDDGLHPECHPDNFLALSTVYLNSTEDTEVKGVDLALTWTKDEVFGGVLSISADATYLQEFSRGTQYLQGTSIAYEAAIDRAGKAELLGAFYTYPKWKGNTHINFELGQHNVRLTSHYYQGVQDVNRNLEQRDDYLTHDLTYQVALPWSLVATLAAVNITDKEPPYVRSQYNYDYLSYSPLGRTIKLGLKTNF